MKLFRLVVHQKNFSGKWIQYNIYLSILLIISEEDLIINPKDLPEAKKGDVVEIYHPPPDGDKAKDYEEENPRLLLQIKTLSEDLLPNKGVAKGEF